MDTKKTLRHTSSVLRLIELALCLFLFTLIFFNKFDDSVGMIMPDKFQHLPLILGISVICIFALEFFVNRPWARLIYVIFASFLCALMNETISYLNMAIWLVGLFYLIILLITFPLYRGKSPSLPQKNPKKMSRQLPAGMINSSQMFMNYFWYSCALVLGIVFMLVWRRVLDQNFILGMVFVIILIILFVIITRYVTDPLVIMKRAYRKFDLTKFSEQISEIKNNNLHPDTYNYVTAIQAKYYFAIDMDRAFELFESTNRPYRKKYLKEYTRIEILYYIRKKDKEKAEELLGEYKTHYPSDHKNYDQLARYIKIYLTREDIPNIRALYPVNGIKGFQRIKHAEILMKYYQKRGEYDEAKIYAVILREIGVEYASWFNESYQVLNDVDDDFE